MSTRERMKRIAQGNGTLDDYAQEIDRVRTIFRRARRQGNREQERVAMSRLVRLHREADDLRNRPRKNQRI